MPRPRSSHCSTRDKPRHHEPTTTKGRHHRLAGRSQNTIASLRVTEVLSPSESILESRREYLMGVTRDALLVLDGARLLHDSRLFVDQRETEMP